LELSDREGSAGSTYFPSNPSLKGGNSVYGDAVPTTVLSFGKDIAVSGRRSYYLVDIKAQSIRSRNPGKGLAWMLMPRLRKNKERGLQITN
jgi:hypothetical protein